MTYYPSAEQLLYNSNKSRLLEIRRSPRSMLSMIFLFLSVVVMSYFVIHFLETAQIVRYIPVIKHLSPRLIAIIPLLILLELLRRLHNDLYIFGMHRLTHLRGRLSFSYNVPVIKYADIRAINVMQDFWGRVFNYGDIAIGTAAHDGNELVISGVNAPVELATLLDQLRSQSMSVEAQEFNRQQSSD